MRCDRPVNCRWLKLQRPYYHCAFAKIGKHENSKYYGMDIKCVTDIIAGNISVDVCITFEVI